ncbi:hypothetical protein ACO0K2_04295 [Undibacterium sp. MH2W]|uniref:hypothetical protein n=1 Tax=Undibacterium sp. MH2W TaxID=3413044 RepID=UPI003BF0FA6F
MKLIYPDVRHPKNGLSEDVASDGISPMHRVGWIGNPLVDKLALNIQDDGYQAYSALRSPDAVTGINAHDDCSAILAVIDLQVAVISRITRCEPDPEKFDYWVRKAVTVKFED